jgi:hypothetical protein
MSAIDEIKNIYQPFKNRNQLIWKILLNIIDDIAVSYYFQLEDCHHL